MDSLQARQVRPGVPSIDGQDLVLSPPACAFVSMLAERFSPALEGLLEQRIERQARRDAGEPLRFPAETAHVRAGIWQAAAAPCDLQDRRVEITGPVDRKMIINALNSGAQVFMADFEDATSPTWENVISGQRNLIDAVTRTITYTQPDTGKSYALDAKTATLVVRPRGLHLTEWHFLVNDAPVPAALFDFGLYLFHNAHALINRRSGPYFYLPKLESHLEARWWNSVFAHAEAALALPPGSIKATVLIETLPAAFEMEEIIYELRDHIVGLNCGRWDFIFSAIKSRREDLTFVLPDRAHVTMDDGFLRAYSRLLIRTCHRRGIHAMGGMAAQIPIKGDPEANDAAMTKVRRDKEREAHDGHDGTWVAHPGLVPVAREIFDRHMPRPNQIGRSGAGPSIAASEILACPTGPRTEAGLRGNIRVAIRYLEAWLRGQGCVPLYGLMEDAATAEISRAQIWQWLRHAARLDDGQVVTRPLVERAIEEEMMGVLEEVRLKPDPTDDDGGRFCDARHLFEDLVFSTELADFLTIPAYRLLVELRD